MGKVKTYTKKDVANEVAKTINMSAYASQKIVHEVFQTLSDMMLSADPAVRIEIRNFGVFEVKPTKAKPRARNPRTNEEIYVPPHRKTHFKQGKILREQFKKPLK